MRMKCSGQILNFVKPHVDRLEKEGRGVIAIDEALAFSFLFRPICVRERHQVLFPLATRTHTPVTVIADWPLSIVCVWGGGGSG